MAFAGRWTIRAAISALLPLLLGACAHGVALAPQARYVAIGSSFAAGPGLGREKPGAPARCGRSFNAYPAVLAERLGLDLADASCGGATTAHLLGPWNELPPQLDAVTPETRLVTATIGGNDIGFVKNLYLAWCRHKPDGKCPAPDYPDEVAWQTLDAQMSAIAREVRRRAPQATLVFVNYVSILPADRLCPATAMAPGDAAILRANAARLADATRKAARANGARLLDAGLLSRNHTPCDAEPWSVGAPGSASGVPWHPNAAGRAALGGELARMLRN